jgi:hypothetical protein
MGLVAFDDVRPPTCMNTSGKECALHSSGMRRTLQALSAAALQRRSRNCSKLFVLVDVSEAWIASLAAATLAFPHVYSRHLLERI